MANLLTFSAEKFPNIAGSSLEEVRMCSLYYLHNGRNAWHSTWVKQYSEGCMHSDERSAKESVERKRTQGSVFYISQLPALLFRSKSGLLAVTEINTLHPFSGYSANAVSKLNAPGTNLIDGALDCYIVTGAPMLGVALSFQQNSRFWSRRPPPRNSVIVVGTEETSTVFSSMEHYGSTTFRSYSNGSAYLLGWSNAQRTEDIRPEHAATIAAQFSM